MLHIAFKGKAAAGTGEGKIFTQLPWVKKAIKEKLGFEPYPGTLNLVLPEKANLSATLRKFKGYAVPAQNGYFSGYLYKALIMQTVDGALVRPELPGYPCNVAELVAPVCLREKLDLKDGDIVEIELWLT